MLLVPFVCDCPPNRGCTRYFTLKLVSSQFEQGLTLGTEVSDVQQPLSHWPFPNELGLMILEDMPSRDLRAVVQVSSLFRELAAPLYLCSVGLLFDDDSLHISTQSCFSLLLYRR